MPQPEGSGGVAEHLRRWHLMAQLTDALETWDGDYQKFTYVAAALIAEEIGDRAAVVLLDPPGHTSPVVGSVHRSPTNRTAAEWLYDELGDDGVRAWVQEFADTEARIQESVVGPILDDAPEAEHRQIIRKYMFDTDVSDALNAPLRMPSGELRGVVICARDRDSAPYDELDRAVLGSAADTIGLGLDLAAAHALERQAAAQAHMFAALSHSSPDFVAIATTDGHLTYLNAAGRKLVGFPDDVDVTQTKANDFYTAGARPIDQDFLTWPQVTVPFWDGVSTLRDWRDDSDIPVSVRSFWVHDEDSGKRIAVASVQRDIRRALAAQQAIAELAEQRRILLGELVNAEQAERQRIAQEVHDESMQLLAASQLRLQLLANHLGSGNIDAATQAADDIAELVSSAQAQLRQLLLDLEPPHTAERQLHEALVDTAKQFFADTDTRVTVSGTFTNVPNDIAAVFHRSGREAVSNARRHAHAQRVELMLAEDDSCWQLIVNDDGVGLPELPPTSPGHLGLRGMISRAEALGGTCTIRPGEFGGTEIVIRIPK